MTQMKEEGNPSSKALLFLDPSEQKESPFLVDSKQDTLPKTKPIFEKLPPSSVLARARDFLPQLADANKKLEDDIKKNTDVNIESVDTTKPYIKMKLAMGVLEEQTGVTEDNIQLPATENEKGKKRPVIEILDSNDSDESDSDSAESESSDSSDVEMVEKRDAT